MAWKRRKKRKMKERWWRVPRGKCQGLFARSVLECHAKRAICHVKETLIDAAETKDMYLIGGI